MTEMSVLSPHTVYMVYGSLAVKRGTNRKLYLAVTLILSDLISAVSEREVRGQSTCVLRD